MKIGIIGCGNISDIYLQNAKRFDVLRLVACADLDRARAEAKAEMHGIAVAPSPEELITSPEVELVVNLTPPQAHFGVSINALRAGKHVYSEKPLALNCEEGRKLLDAAREKGVRLGCAPDTFLGAGHQGCRRIIDAGELGRPVAASAFMMCRGHESWHPDPEFYYQAGGGPVFDMGPYYISAMVSLMGPVRRVTGVTSSAMAERTIGGGPKQGQKIPVNTPTHVSAILEFSGGAVCTMVMSFDVWHHGLPFIEIYCADGSLSLPDPNGFGGAGSVRLDKGKSWRKIASTHGYEENSRGLGLADMVRAIQNDRPHRASAELAYHTLDVMESIYDAAREGRPVEVTSTCEKPARMAQGLQFGQLDD